MKFHKNNFNLIRLIAATLVLISHCYALSTGNPLLEPLRVRLGVTWGSIAVDIFFVTSGYLVTASIARSQNAIHFVANRVIRIYPGLLTALFVTVLISGTWFSNLSAVDFWSNTQTWKYLLKNGLLLLPNGLEWLLPETLNGVPWSTGAGGTINGSLWTLPWELKMYILLLFAFVLTKCVAKYWNPCNISNIIFLRALMILVAVSAVGYDLYLSVFTKHDLPRHMFAMFFCGAAIWAMNIDLSKAWRYGVAALLLVLVVSAISPANFFPVYILTIPWIVLAAAYAPTTVLFQYNKMDDYSYGMYIYAFPVQQWCAYLFRGISTWEMAALSLPVVLIFSALSWHLVEKKALKLKFTSPSLNNT